MKRDSKRTRKIRNLVLVCVLSALLLTVSTYAWFIGMQTVNVTQFEIEIAGVDSLMLSMDGATWSPTIAPTAEATKVYATNTNQFDKGLIPMSSVGDMDLTASRMKLFEKGSLTATTGGYRLMAKQVKNDVALTDESGEEVDGQFVEGDGYVAFDLFVMNLSGEAYYEDITDPSNEEAIYLTYDSSVKAEEAGATDSGIENSVRVAFAQIGRVSATDFGNVEAESTQNKVITGMTCNLNEDGDPSYTEETGVTGICRDAQIWEPNETAHVEAAKTWYEKSCKKRNNTQGKFEYSADACTTLGTEYLATSAVKTDILANDYVDVYDGAYNTFTATDSKLEQVNTFTDSEKLAQGNARNEFMTLAPNSITKIRVYIWLEGQDVDNYDFASLGKKITVNFGFTKERFTTEDIDENIEKPEGAESLPEEE